jgi:hypothetical protein
MLDLFCGRFGWGRAFAARGWEVVGIDLVEPPEIPQGCRFVKGDILECGPSLCYGFDFVCASSPCEEFSVHGMKHFHPNPKYPELGIRLFNHTRWLCESHGAPYVMENVRPAQQFVGNAVNHCGPFYLWGNGVPPLMPQNIKKGMRLGTGYEGFSGKFREWTREQKKAARKSDPILWASSRSAERKEATAKAATIPPELSACVAEYAERLLEHCKSKPAGEEAMNLNKQQAEKVRIAVQKMSNWLYNMAWEPIFAEYGKAMREMVDEWDEASKVLRYQSVQVEDKNNGNR